MAKNTITGPISGPSNFFVSFTSTSSLGTVLVHLAQICIPPILLCDFYLY